MSGFAVALILWNVFMLCLLEPVWSLMLGDEFGIAFQARQMLNMQM